MGVKNKSMKLTHIPQNWNVFATNLALLDCERAILFIFHITLNKAG